MDTASELKWVEAPRNHFIEQSQNVLVIWQRSFYCTDTKVREVDVESNLDWGLFSANCLLPWYKNDLDWSNPNAENFSLREYARLFPKELKDVPNAPILSAYHGLLDKRIIVDGFHRAVALQSEIDRKGRIPKVRIIECYGSQIHSIFPCDFCNLLIDALRVSGN
jgi:hypothetical protein